MKMVSSRLIIALLLVGTALGSNLNSWKLNVPRVLLPLVEGASFKLFSKGGCFTWKSTRPEVNKSFSLGYLNIRTLFMT